MGISTINKVDGDYALLSLWEADKEGDITGLGPEIARVYNDFGEMIELAPIDFYSWTTTPDDYIQIYVPLGHRRPAIAPLRYGFGARVWFYVSLHCIELGAGAEYFRLEGLEVKVTGMDEIASGVFGNGIIVRRYNDDSVDLADYRIGDCILLGSGNGNGIAIEHGGGQSPDYTVGSYEHPWYIWNTLIYNCEQGIYTRGNGQRHIYVYNCTIYGIDDYGILHSDQGLMTVDNTVSYNPIVGGFTVDFSVRGSTSDYNFSKDDTAPGNNSIHGDTESKYPAFVSVAGEAEDFHITESSDCINTAIANPSDLFERDIDRNLR